MTTRAYYNEVDPFAASWLRELITRNLIAPGDVDERDIRDVLPSDLIPYTQHHFFAGIGVWSYALRLAGWPDNRPVWTGSCPCQPFSVAGKGAGTSDERHLWPSFFHLIEQFQPAVVFGEQVEAAIRLGWLDLVQDDMEGRDYAFAAAGFGAASVGAPHIRQRLYFAAKRVADADDTRLERRSGSKERSAEFVAGESGLARGLADTDGRNSSAEGVQRGREHGLLAESGRSVPLAHTNNCQPGTERSDTREVRGVSETQRQPELGAVVLGGSGPTNGFWRDAEWIYCRDQKYRPIEPGPVEVVDGTAGDLGLVRLSSYPDRTHEERLVYAPLIQKGKARVGRLRGYGNAIVAQQAAAFITAYMESIN